MVNLKNSVVSCALSAALCSSAWAAPPPAAVADPEVYVGGVFSRPVGPAIQPPQTSRFRPALPLLFDAQGKANQIMVLLDFADPTFVGRAIPADGMEGVQPADQITREEAVLNSLNRSSGALRAQFGNPLYSDYLLWETRQSVATRARARADSPSERLERYLLLTYDSVEAATAALKVLLTTRGVLAVEQDQKLKFTSVPYNDPYAQWQGNSAVAATYQWGHYAMNFINASGQGAHDVHQGHGYVATLDGLGANSTSLAGDLVPNVRQHLSGPAATDPYSVFHGTFVNAIVAAKANNGSGVSGACPNCSLMLYGGGSVSEAARDGLLAAVKFGAPVVNMSFGITTASNVMDIAISLAARTMWRCPRPQATKICRNPTTQQATQASCRSGVCSRLHPPVHGPVGFKVLGPARARTGQV